MLLAYATEQGQVSQPPTQPSMTIIPSQSAPTTPQLFPMQNYSMHEGEYTDSNSYFPTSMQPPASSRLPNLPYQQVDPPFPGYYSAGQSSSAADMSSLNPQTTMYVPTQSQQAPQLVPSMPPAMEDFPPIHNPLESMSGSVEVMSSRPKPRCWDHGCNGRQFSTFSNLLRHQREKSGSAMKALCPYCGTEFTRSTARNGHMYGGKCKGRPDAEPSDSGSTGGKEPT